MSSFQIGMIVLAIGLAIGVVLAIVAIKHDGKSDKS